MRTRAWFVAVTFLALLVRTSWSASQSLVGALAIDEGQGDRWGWAVDYETAATARGAALRECGPGCSVVLTFVRCGAYAADQDTASTAFGWAESYGSTEGARQRALAECRSRGGSECLVRAWGCNGPVVEEELGFDQAARRRIQAGLLSAGFDPGGTDGLFGPRTRAAIRAWQVARGERATGYLDARAADTLRSVGPTPRRDAVAPATPAASAAPQVSPIAPTSAELEGLFWQSIMNSTNPTEFEAYLAQFPNGVFRTLAVARLAALRERSDTATAATGGPRGGSGTDAPTDRRRPTPGRAIHFGDDTGEFVRDGECDDSRFEGDGVSLGGSGVTGERGRDATDCRQLYDEGRIRLFGVDLDSGYIDFGDDGTALSIDGVCQDPRFVGSNSVQISDSRGHDATDCRRLYDAGRIRLSGIDIESVR